MVAMGPRVAEKDKEFDGNTERLLRPREWPGDEILEELNRLDFAPFGKTISRTRPSTHMNWTHKPMFFELPYWSKLKLRHNLDVMHVEKNVFDIGGHDSRYRGQDKGHNQSPS
ncbi:transposable element gene [Prunus dulcis]|uniref:Transposable element protein n=1 Tax=Prunus dulcis TaxID=3755 RepID=A0A5H2XQR9_PRUDU|nr:transposable element gene [Prunus dulcis]